MNNNNNVTQLIAEGAQQNAERRLQKADSTYVREWKKFKAFVLEKRNNNTLNAHANFITREAVDLYFTEKVSKLVVTPKVAERVRCALQFYADKLEYVGQGFVVDSKFVKEGLSSQIDAYIDHKITNACDPHKNLPSNNLSSVEHLNALTAIFQNNFPSWSSLFQSWNLMNNTFIRCDTFLKVTLPHLLLDKVHGPPIDHDNVQPMMALILHPEQLKEGKRIRKKRITGCWRHRHYLRCATGAVAFSLFYKLHYLDINFYKGRRNRKPMWWNIKLANEWSSTKAANQAYIDLLDSCGVSWRKITHLRSAGIEQASSTGELDASMVGTLSKHQTSNLDRVYMTELFPPILRVMAGFSFTENRGKTNSCIYHVPRSFINLPWTDNEIVHFIFPNIDSWQEQYQSPEGDQSEAAKNFLFEMLPFLAKVVVQDGIFWVKDFPNHALTRLLLSSMPANYERWAAETREKLKEDEKNENEILASSLNDAAKAALLQVKEVVMNEMICMNRRIEDIGTVLSSVEHKIESMEQTIGRNVMASTNNNNSNTNTNENEASNAVPAPHPPPQVRLITDVIRNTPLVPDFPSDMPESMEEMLNEYRKYELARWEKVKMKNWKPKSIQQAYGRRKYINSYMSGKAMGIHQGTYEQRMNNSAKMLDTDRNNLGYTVAQYIVHLKKNDSTVKKRKKRKQPCN